MRQRAQPRADGVRRVALLDQAEERARRQGDGRAGLLEADARGAASGERVLELEVNRLIELPRSRPRLLKTNKLSQPRPSPYAPRTFFLGQFYSFFLLARRWIRRAARSPAGTTEMKVARSADAVACPDRGLPRYKARRFFCVFRARFFFPLRLKPLFSAD